MKTERNVSHLYADLLSDGSDQELQQLVGDLHRLYTAPTPPAQLSVAITRAIQQRTAEREREAAQRRPFFPRWLPRGMGAVAVLLLVLLLGGGVYAIAPVLSRAFDQAQEYDPGLQYVLDNYLYEEVDLSQTVDGYTVHLQRVYADASRVIIGYTISGPESQGNLEGYGLDVENTTLITASGVALPWYYGGSQVLEAGDQGATQGNVLMFDAAVIENNPTEVSLRLDIGELWVSTKDDPSLLPNQDAEPTKAISGPFSFNFTVPFYGTQVREAIQTVVVDAPRVQATRPLESGDVEMIETVATQPVAVMLERLIVAPSETRVYFRLPAMEDVASTDVTTWATFSGDGWTSEDLTTIIPSWPGRGGWGNSGNVAMNAREQDGLYVLYFHAPLHEKHGEWTINVPYISAPNPGTMRSDGIMGTKTITGPWEFRFIVP